MTLGCFDKNDRIGAQHYKSVQKMFRIECTWAIGPRNNIMAGTGKEASVSAEIRDGAVQEFVSLKFVLTCAKKLNLNKSLMFI